MLSNIDPPSGRFQYTRSETGVVGIVDYAHTPDALEKAILALRPHTEKRIITIFGCGGDRDKTKRPLMGAIAEKHSDIAIITDDNPRSECPGDIHKDILGGFQNKQDALIIPSRKDAFVKALDLLEKNDILLIAGKGHEDGQVIGDIKHPFKDASVIKELI